MFSPGFNPVHTTAERINRRNPYANYPVADSALRPSPTTLVSSTPSSTASNTTPPTDEAPEQRFKRLCKLLPPRLNESLLVNKALAVGDQLLQVQQVLDSLQYNFLPQTFFNLRKNRPLKRIFETAKDIITESLPIRCLEATFLALYLTQSMRDIRRVPLALKSTCNGRSFRHIVLVVESKGKYGALGLSRRDTLQGRLPCQFDSLLEVVEDFREAYKQIGHRLATFKVGLYVTHNPQNIGVVPCWRFLTLRMPLLQAPKPLETTGRTPSPDSGGESASHSEHIPHEGRLTPSGVALTNFQAMLPKLSQQYHAGAFDLEPPAVTPNKKRYSPPTSPTQLASAAPSPQKKYPVPLPPNVEDCCGVRQVLFEHADQHDHPHKASCIDSEIDRFLLERGVADIGPQLEPILTVPQLETCSECEKQQDPQIVVGVVAVEDPSHTAQAFDEENEDDDECDSDTELNQCRTFCMLNSKSPFHPTGSLDQIYVVPTSPTIIVPTSPSRKLTQKNKQASASSVAPTQTAADVARMAAATCPGFEEFVATQQDLAAAALKALQAKSKMRAERHRKDAASPQKNNAQDGAHNDDVAVALSKPIVSRLAATPQAKTTAIPKAVSGKSTTKTSASNRLTPQRKPSEKSVESTPNKKSGAVKKVKSTDEINSDAGKRQGSAGNVADENSTSLPETNQMMSPDNESSNNENLTHQPRSGSTAPEALRSRSSEDEGQYRLEASVTRRPSRGTRFPTPLVVSDKGEGIYAHAETDSDATPSSLVQRIRSTVESCHPREDHANNHATPSSDDGNPLVAPIVLGSLAPSRSTTPHPPLTERRLPKLNSRSASFVGPKIISLQFGHSGSMSPPECLANDGGSPSQWQRSMRPAGSSSPTPPNPRFGVKTNATSPSASIPTNPSLSRTLPAASGRSLGDAWNSATSPSRPRTSLGLVTSPISRSWQDLDSSL